MFTVIHIMLTPLAAFCAAHLMHSCSTDKACACWCSLSAAVTPFTHLAPLSPVSNGANVSLVDRLFWLQAGTRQSLKTPQPSAVPLPSPMLLVLATASSMTPGMSTPLESSPLETLSSLAAGPWAVDSLGSPLPIPACMFSPFKVGPVAAEPHCNESTCKSKVFVLSLFTSLLLCLFTNVMLV